MVQCAEACYATSCRQKKPGNAKHTAKRDQRCASLNSARTKQYEVWMSLINSGCSNNTNTIKGILNIRTRFECVDV